MLESSILDAGLGDADDDDFDEAVEAFDSQLPENRYLDRELSWLAFNQRVLELGEDPAVPVLERANFLAIFASNLDEFFMVRVAGLKRRIITGLAVPTNVGRSPAEVLADISADAYRLQVRHAEAWRSMVQPDLAEAGIEIVSWASLGDDDRAALYEYFQSQVFPVLMPLAVDPAHPFPYISGLSLNLAVRIRNARTGRQEFARLKVPPMLPRFVEVPGATSPGRGRYLPLEDLISNNLIDLFPGMEVLDHHAFRLTRNEDMTIEEDESENLIQALEAELLRRRFGPPIRLEITDDMDDVTLGLLIRELDITAQEVYRLPGPLDLRGLFDLSRIDRPDLHYPPHLPTTALAFQPGDNNERADIFASIREGDVLVHHPYESFATSVQAFLEQAAKDPHVLAIKQTLYRTSGDSPIVEALIDAAEAGKQVLALVEIKARFDEAANIVWARKLEKAGVHVVYGLVGLKTHCKLALVIREEGGVLRSYSHVGTGNYNPKTSRIYEDFGLFTADDQVGRDLTRLFNELSGYAIEKKFKRLLVAPLHLRKGLLRLIDKERRNALAGKPARIRFKVNSMVDEQIIDALYRAGQAGVSIEIWVRGICSLKPGVDGVSENITVRSILGRYLEHSRIFAFESGGDRQVYIGSADMMHRNLDRRVEALVRVTAPAHLKELDALFDLAMSDGTGSWWLGPEGEWVRHSTDAEGRPLIDIQDKTMHDVQRRRRAGGPMTDTAVYAAGAVIWRLVQGKLRILVIHRTAYADVTLPKGKVDPGEMLAETAVREVFEETGIRVALGVPVGVSRYRLPNKRQKIVHYWAAEATEDAIRASAFVPNKEVAALEWVSPKRAQGYLSYPIDVEILDNFLKVVDDGVLQTFPLIVLRHGKAIGRDAWTGADALRALSARGTRQAHAIVGPLRAFGARRIVSSDAVRCVTTVTPLAAALGKQVRRTELLSQDAWEQGRADVRSVVGKRVRSGRPAVLCSHGPLLPEIMTEIALATGTLRGSYLGSASALEVAAFSVVHVSATNPGSGIVAIETHAPKQ